MRFNSFKYIPFIVCLLFSTLSFAEESANVSTEATSSSNQSYAITASGGNNAGGQTAQADQFSGAVTYSIPIPLPPARGSVQPQLSLDYNSHRKNANSWVGYGWEMDLGAIERTASQGHIDYENGTTFQARLAGQTETLELKSANISNASDYGISVPTGAVIDLYRSKIESAFNYYFYIHHSAMDYGWVVIDKSGTRYFYGTDVYSREQKLCTGGSSCLKVSKWYLKKVVDTNQNELNVTYNRYRNISQIVYQDITVEFNFTLQNKFPVFRQSFVLQKGYKLADIIVKSNSTRLQKFSFTYDQSNWNGISFLNSIQQYGKIDVADLPATSFEYYDEASLSWSTTSYDRQASVNNSTGNHQGYIDNYLQLMDMNGDGLKDKVVAYEGTDQIHVYYNDGNDFVYVNGKSDWTDPFGATICPATSTKCKGKLFSYYSGIPSPGQWVYIMDMNGDSLPDRVRAQPSPSGNPDEAIFEISFHNGTGWNSTLETWNDPYVGEYAGMTTDEVFFMDMNGDGLIDRVYGVGEHATRKFHVHYNTGTGFDPNPTVWEDPVIQLDIYSGVAGKLSASDESTAGGVYGTIRDFNGDGLPDRLYQAELTDSTTGVLIGTGWTIFLNLNGLEWAQGTSSSTGGVTIDGHEVLFVLDNQSEYKAYINKKQDLMDMNGDGYLDLVLGFPDDQNFKIYFYSGMEPGKSYSEYTNGITISDPVQDPNPDDWNGTGYIQNTHSGDRTDHGDYLHTFIMDVDGDGFPDRVSTDPRGTTLSRSFKVYPLQMNAVAFSETNALWNNPQVNQPAGKLKGVDTGTGSISKIEYLPSTWPRRWSTNFSGLPLNHRFLPFNLWLGFKMYALDYSLTTSEAGPEALRYPGMRWTRNDYYGGHFFIRRPTSTQDKFTQFNGFQTVTTTTQKGVAETWKDFSNTTIFYQALGDVETVDPLDQSVFVSSAYTHFALSGKPYYKTTEEDGINLSVEVSDYTVLNAAATGNFECNDPDPCIPQLTTQTKTVRESGSANTRTTQVTFEYDAWNNPTIQTHKDSAGNRLIVQETEYYDYTDFDPTLHLRDRPYIQRKTDGSTTYKYKEFAYDSVGNPVEEKWQVTSTDMATVTRQFNSNGTVKQMTDADGVTKYFTYDSDGLFPHI